MIEIERENPIYRGRCVCVCVFGSIWGEAVPKCETSFTWIDECSAFIHLIFFLKWCSWFVACCRATLNNKRARVQLRPCHCLVNFFFAPRQITLNILIEWLYFAFCGAHLDARLVCRLLESAAYHDGANKIITMLMQAWIYHNITFLIFNSSHIHSMFLRWMCCVCVYTFFFSSTRSMLMGNKLIIPMNFRPVISNANEK